MGKLSTAIIQISLSLLAFDAGAGASHGPFPLEETSLTAVHAALQEGRITCRGLVRQYLVRIRTYDQATGLNAIVTLNPDALADADRLDAEFRRTHRLRPLHCAVAIVKDNYETRGLQTTAGSLAMKGFVPERDAHLVRRLREAGGIVLAKSNMAEWAFSPYKTESSIAGITRNPYALDRVPAGSSGGTAAAVAANLGLIGLGTDTGNSIRGPSSHDALVGIRPTIGLTSRAGIVPLFAGNDVGGPMVRSVADAAAVLGAIAGYDPEDPITALSVGRAETDYTRYLDRQGLRGARIAVFRRYVDTATTDPEIRALTDAAVADLKAAGATIVEPFDIDHYDDLVKNIWCGDFEADLNAYLATRGHRARYHSLGDIVASGLYLPYIADDLHSALSPPTAPDDRRAPCPDVYHDPPKIAFRTAVTHALEEAHVDAIVYPTWSNPPRRVGDMESPAGDNSQILSPQTGWPAITVPMGYTHGTLPAGLTFFGTQFSEPMLIRYAYAYEQATHHRRAPDGFGPVRRNP
jgi:Asp-tRNA(Asn)/Glu-tRNA(Gln) amidotransferase A subunit family amidase